MRIEFNSVFRQPDSVWHDWAWKSKLQSHYSYLKAPSGPPWRASLFAPKRHHGIDLGRPAGRKVPPEDRRHDDREQHCTEC